MTTYFPFFTSNTVAPSFQPTLDGNVYNCVLTRNLFGQDYYVNCFDQSGNIVFSVALTETAPSMTIETMSWDGAALTTTVTMQNPLPPGYAIGMTMNMTVSGATPSGYNGTFPMLVTGGSSLTFPLPVDPGQIAVAGQLSYLISLCQGYFDSTLVFRSNQFEVSP